MAPNRETILSDALKLTEPDREVLVDEILASLGTGTNGSPSNAWGDVVAQRLREIDSGQVKMIPGEEVLEKLKALTHGRSR